MSTKKIGTALIGLGIITFIISAFITYSGIGDKNLGAAQILGMETSVVILLGFLIVYFSFFLAPVFLNSERSMYFFGRCVPSATPSGFDVAAVVRYIQDWLISSRSPYADSFIAYPPLALVLFAPLLLVGYPAYYYFITFLTLLFYGLSTLVVPLSNGHGRSSSLALIAVYLYHARKDADYPAYLPFTVGVQMKIYPAILGLCLLSVLMSSYQKMRPRLNLHLLAICTVCAMVVPSISNDYKLPLLTVPLGMLWGSIVLPASGLKRVLSILLVLATSLAYWSMQHSGGIKPALLSRNFPPCSLF